MSEREAALCSFHEYALRVAGFERAAQLKWEIARWETWQMLMPNFKRSRMPKTPQAFFRFPWEKMTEEETREAMERSQVSQAEIDALNALFNKDKDNGKDR